MHYVTSEPPKGGAPLIPIIRVLSPQNRSFTILGTGVQGYLTHWNGNRTIGHREPSAECEGCRCQYDVRWKGYLHVFDHYAGREGFLEITPRAYEDIRVAVGEHGLVRGAKLMVRRTKGGAHGRLVFEWLPSMAKVDELLPARCPLDTLEKLWTAE